MIRSFIRCYCCCCLLLQGNNSISVCRSCKLSERLEIKNKIVLTEMNFHENFNFYFFLMSFAILFQMFKLVTREKIICNM